MNVDDPSHVSLQQKFQDLEEERIDFMKSSLWSFANIASTVCVTDDAVSQRDVSLGFFKLTKSSRVRRSDYPLRIVMWRKTLPLS